MALLSVIRRWHLREQLSIREIARRTGLSRNTIRKYLRAGDGRAEVQGAGAAEQARSVCRQAVGLAEDGGRQVPQAAADAEAAPCRSGRASATTGSYGRVAAFAREWRADRQREQQTTGRGTFVPLAFQPGRGVPVRLERGLGGHRRGAHEAAGRAHQARAQPGLPAPGLSAADPRDAVRCSLARVPRLRRRAAARHLRQHEDGGRPGRPRQGAAGQRPLPGHGQPLSSSSPSSAIRRQAGRRGRSRRTCRMPATGSGSRCRAFPTWRR